jgi:hypothetical protein
MSSWLPLLNYSTKYNISLSTLRRRIKAKTIEFRLDQGKYLILDEGAQMPLTPPDEGLRRKETSVAAAPKFPSELAQDISQEVSRNLSHSNFVEASVLTSANRLVEEIKSAYAKILQEKEEQISVLKEEIGDLRMLVRILEDSNQKTSSMGKTEKVPSPAEEADANYFFGDFQNRRL